MKWQEKDTYKGKERHFEAHIGELDIIIHRWQTDPDKWFLTVRHGPFNLDRVPLLELDVDGAKTEAVDLLVKKADEIQNALHTAAGRDSKKIQNFKLRLVTILNEVENLWSLEKHGDLPALVADGLNKIEDTIKTAMSDLCGH